MALFLVRDLGIAVWVFGLLHTVNTLLIVFLEVPLNLATAHWPHRRTLVLGSLLVAAGFGALAFARSLPAVVATVVVWTFGEMMLLPGMASWVADVAPSGSRGAYMGLYTMAFSLAFVVGQPLGTVLLDKAGGRALWLVMLALGLVSAFLFSRVLEPGRLASAGRATAYTLTKSMKPRSTSVEMSFTRTLSPTSRPASPRTTLPSTGGLKIRTHVPLSDAPVTTPSNRSPMRVSRSSAAAALRTRRSTLFAASSCSVQWSASPSSSETE